MSIQELRTYLDHVKYLLTSSDCSNESFLKKEITLIENYFYYLIQA